MINEDPGHSAETLLYSQVLTLLFLNPGDVNVVPREGLIMGKGSIQEVWARAIY